MSNPSKRKGTTAETRVVKFLKRYGIAAERRALAGSSDNGDLRTYTSDGTEVTLEVKAGEQTAMYTRSQFNVWKSQTLVESENSGCICALVIVRHRRPLRNAEVWMPNGQWGISDIGWTMLFLDEFAKEVCLAEGVA